MSLEALRANMKPYDTRLHELRGFQGAVTSARNLKRVMEGSDLVTGKEKVKIQLAHHDKHRQWEKVSTTESHGLLGDARGEGPRGVGHGDELDVSTLRGRDADAVDAALGVVARLAGAQAERMQT